MTITDIDWAATGAMLGGIGSILGAIAVIVAAWFAYQSFEEWKRRAKYKDDRALAIDALAIFYEARFSMDAIRSPFTSASELDEADRIIMEAKVALTQAQKARHQKRLVVMTRLQHANDFWQSISRIIPRVHAVFGEDTKKHMQTLLDMRQRIYAAGSMFQYDLAPENSLQYESVIWKGAQVLAGEEEDQIDVVLNASQAELEQTFREYIK